MCVAQVNSMCILSIFGKFFKRIYLLIFSKGNGGEKERKRNINPGLVFLSTQTCALTGNWTSSPLVCSLVLIPLSHTSQGSGKFLTAHSLWSVKSYQFFCWGLCKNPPGLNIFNSLSWTSLLLLSSLHEAQHFQFFFSENLTIPLSVFILIFFNFYHLWIQLKHFYLTFQVKSF